MAKYHALKQFLLSSEQSKIKLSFSDIEEIIGDKLPCSAYTYNARRSNKGHSHAEFWTSAASKGGYIKKLQDGILKMARRIIKGSPLS